jgi:predicted TIM-barrel fold metal-dependent hydrolase
MEPPAGFRYVDAHTHLHPPRLFAAIRRWFDEHTDWNLSGPTEPDEVVAALRGSGVERFAFFSYAHRPGMARELNRWVHDTAARFPDAIPLGTVHAADDDPAGIVEEACGGLGLAGLKLHIQVQRFHPDDPRILPVYARLVELDRVLVIHVGTGPHRNEYTGLAGFVRVLERFPGLRAAICHMGAFETRAALGLLDRFPGLHLDTTMAMTRASTPYTGIDPGVVRDEDLVRHADRILFGSDFPNLPYAYEAERADLWARDLPLSVYQRIFRDNARAFFGLGR